ncbi:MAG: DUF6263 family protein [Bacteroidales bacterium]|jgi:hypothetical protein|nr:DUF6263 family protein [Bacteroidales bacterium]NLK79330.1 hypothetical protein [Bacteroidales bacterium]HKM31218.1 DUF6263 family protein [Bacteroidales bacterium]
MRRLLSVLFVFVAFALQGQNIKLEFKPVKGVEYPVNLEVNQTTTLRVPMMGDMVTESEQILGAVVTLAEETEQGYVVEACLTRVTLRTSAQGQTKVYDSEGEDIMSQAIRSLMGKPFKMLVSPLGQVLEQFPVPEDMFAEADSTLATQYARRRRATAMEEIKAIFKEATIKSVVESGLTKFPGRLLAVPSVWTEDDTSEELGALVTVQQRLTALEGNCASLTATIVVMPDPNAKKQEASQRIENISGSGQATSTINTDSGWVVQSEGTQHLKGTFVVEQGGMVQTIDLVMDVKTKASGVR